MRCNRHFLLLPLLCLTGAAHAADDVTIVGALDFAYKDMTLEAAGGGGAQKFGTTLTTLNPGVAIAYKRFYANVNFDKSIDSASTTQIDQGQPSMLTMSRSDTVLTLGYRAFDFLSLYAGWLSGDIGAYLVGQQQVGGANITAFYTQEISYTEKGPFAGMSLSHHFGDKGSISFSAAYARLNGEMSQTRNTGSYWNGAIFVSPTTRYTFGTGEIKGASYSLVWTGLLNGSMNYRVGIKSIRYEGTAIGNQPGISEYYTSFFLGLTNTF